MARMSDLRECPYPRKKYFTTRQHARRAAREIKRKVEAVDGFFNTLYPYRCPASELDHVESHWHLSRSRQGAKNCPHCEARVPSWYDASEQVWVIYAHGECPTQAVPK